MLFIYAAFAAMPACLTLFRYFLCFRARRLPFYCRFIFRCYYFTLLLPFHAIIFTADAIIRH